MSNRKLDQVQYDGWRAINGYNKSSAISFLDVKTGIGFFTLRRICQGKKLAKPAEQLAICLAIGLDLDVLFPACETAKRTA